MPGKVEKASCEPYSYVVKETSKTITLTHRFEYVMDYEPVQNSRTIPQEQVHNFLEKIP